MGVRDRLPGQALVRELRDQNSTIAELKASQTFGSSSVLTYRIFSSNPYDTTVVSAGSFVAHRIDVEFIPDDLTFGGAFCHRLEVKAMTTANVVVRTSIIVQRRPSIDSRQQWSIYLQTFGSPSDTRRLKFYFFSTGSGSFTVNVIA